LKTEALEKLLEVLAWCIIRNSNPELPHQTEQDRALCGLRGGARVWESIPFLSSFIYFTLIGYIAEVDVVDRFCLEQSSNVPLRIVINT